jgi:hypothetical protein
MRTHCLQRIVCVEAASIALRRLLPGQESTWLLVASTDDPIAYFNIHAGEHANDGMARPAVTADISGRHNGEDAAVIAVLESLQKSVGGEIILEP